jgi:hypothetical protein
MVLQMKIEANAVRRSMPARKGHVHVAPQHDRFLQTLTLLLFDFVTCFAREVRQVVRQRVQISVYVTSLAGARRLLSRREPLDHPGGAGHLTVPPVDRL